MRFLVDSMFPSTVCSHLNEFGHDAAHVRDRGAEALPDPAVAALARSESRVLVTENVKDFATEADIVVVCVLKSRLHQHRMAIDLSALLNEWARDNPDPYIGLHWPPKNP